MGKIYTVVVDDTSESVRLPVFSLRRIVTFHKQNYSSVLMKCLYYSLLFLTFKYF